MNSSKKRSLSSVIKEYLILFLTFFKIGLFTFGGGYAMLSLIEDEVVSKKHWISKEELFDIFAIAESTPGPVAINTATFIGVKRLGIFGGITATLGVVVPSFLIILLVSFIIDLVRDNHWIQVIFMGIRVGVIVLIFKAVISFCKSIKRNLFSALLLIAGFLIVFLTNVSVIYVILGTILISIIVVSLVTYRNNLKYHMTEIPEYYSELYGKPVESCEYVSEINCRDNNIKIVREDDK